MNDQPKIALWLVTILQSQNTIKKTIKPSAIVAIRNCALDDNFSKSRSLRGTARSCVKPHAEQVRYPLFKVVPHLMHLSAIGHLPVFVRSTRLAPRTACVQPNQKEG